MNQVIDSGAEQLDQLGGRAGAGNGPVHDV